MALKKLLFSVTIDGCEVQAFRSGGKGGQNQNKVESGVRIIHHPSGARAESRETRDQLENKRRAWKRLVTSDTFQRWHRVEVSKRLGQKSVDDLVEEAMQPQHIKVEVRNGEGKWVDAEKA